jgi:hypothetical protein
MGGIHTMKNAMGKRITAAVAGVLLFGLAACAQPVSGTGTPAPTNAGAQPSTSAPPTSTITVTPTVTPSATVTVSPPPAKQTTSCQRMHAEGFSYAEAYAEWQHAGRPPAWDADHDGYPCEQTYGNQN